MTTAVLTEYADVLEKAKLEVAVRKPVDQRAPLQRFMYMNQTTAESWDGYKAPSIAHLREDDTFGTPIRLSELAHKQLFSRIDYPYKLTNRLSASTIWKSVNELIQVEGKRDALMRYVNAADDEGQVVRAILGSAYQPFDNDELLALVLGHVDGAKVQYESITDTALHLTVVWPEAPVEDNSGGDLGLVRGVHISNSEVGFRSVCIEPVVWRPVCNNILASVGLAGLEKNGGGYGSDGNYYRKVEDGAHNLQGSRRMERGSGGWRMRHTGSSERLEAFVNQAMEDAKGSYDGVIARWRDGLTQPVSDPIGAIEKLAVAGQLTGDQLRAALDAWGDTVADFAEQARTRTGVANAYTLAAQTMEDAEQRYDMQHVGAAAFTINLN